MFNSRQKQEDLTSRLLPQHLENGSWAGTQPLRLICNRFKLKPRSGRAGEGRPSFEVEERSVHVNLCIGVCVWDRLEKANAERSVCLRVCVCVHVCVCVCVFEMEIEGADSIHWGTRGHRCEERKCTFSFSQGGGWVVRQLESYKMQVVLLNVLVSSKPDKSNQVLSGSATISWLFEPSGPCSSDLWWRILSRHLKAM